MNSYLMPTLVLQSLALSTRHGKATSTVLSSSVVARIQGVSLSVTGTSTRTKNGSRLYANEQCAKEFYFYRNGEYYELYILFFHNYTYDYI